MAFALLWINGGLKLATWDAARLGNLWWHAVPLACASVRDCCSKSLSHLYITYGIGEEFNTCGVMLTFGPVTVSCCNLSMNVIWSADPVSQFKSHSSSVL